MNFSKKKVLIIAASVFLGLWISLTAWFYLNRLNDFKHGFAFSLLEQSVSHITNDSIDTTAIKPAIFALHFHTNGTQIQIFGDLDIDQTDFIPSEKKEVIIRSVDDNIVISKFRNLNSQRIIVLSYPAEFYEASKPEMFWPALWQCFVLTLIFFTTIVSFLIFFWKQIRMFLKTHISQFSSFGAIAYDVNETFSESIDARKRRNSDFKMLNSLVDELQELSEQNAEQTQRANALSDDISTSTSLGTITLGSLNDTMQDISNSMEETKSIIKAIDEIAFQTNILALNANVEAARAGESGAGFAVVANEVRRLAMKTTDAARETSAILEQAKNFVLRGDQVTNEVTDTFQQIDEKIVKVYRLLSKLADAVDQQNVMINDVRNKVRFLDRSDAHIDTEIDDIKSKLTLLNQQSQDLTQPIKAAFDTLEVDLTEINQQIDELKEKVGSGFEKYTSVISYMKNGKFLKRGKRAEYEIDVENSDEESVTEEPVVEVKAKKTTSKPKQVRPKKTTTVKKEDSEKKESKKKRVRMKKDASKEEGNK